MTATGWIVLGLWGAAAPFNFRKTFRYFRDQSHGCDDWADFWFFTYISSMSAFVGPLMPAYNAIRHIGVKRLKLQPDKLAVKIAGESKEAKIKRLEKEAKSREQRLTQLEREVGVNA